MHQWDSGHLRTVWAIRSHQLEESFNVSPKNRYGSNIVPNRSFVSANQWADNICNAILRFQRNAFHSRCSQQVRRWLPSKVSIGITGPSFIITHNGVSLDRSVSTAIDELCDREFIRRIVSRPTQGLIIRLRESLFIKPEMIGRQSYLRRSLEGKTKTHTRAMYTDTDYRKAIVYKYAIDELWDDDLEKIARSLKNATKTYDLLRCPCCVDVLNKSTSNSLPSQHKAEAANGLYGNLRHYRFYCLNDNIQAIRDTMNQLLEDHLSTLFKIASYWGRLGFSTLLNRAVDALITLDRLPFHNALTNEQNYVKAHKSLFACLNMEDWLSLVDSMPQSNHSAAHDKFSRWPLLHQLGFIPANCYTHEEMEDGEYSPCDLLSMGIIPTVLNDIITQFAKELGTRHSQETKKDFLHQWQQVRAVALIRAISITMAAGAHIAEYKKTLIATLPASIFHAKSDSCGIVQPCAQTSNDDSTASPKLTKQPDIATKPTKTECFPCIGITCSPPFLAKTNLRHSNLSKDRSVCRRCSTMRKAIECAISIEHHLSLHNDNFEAFYTTLQRLKNKSADVIIRAISTLHPRPTLFLSSYLQRSTKRNVFPTVIMNTVRLLCGTFGWNISEFPTSLDLAFNQTCASASITTGKCKCEASVPFFSCDSQAGCPKCGGSSIFFGTADRMKYFTSQQASTIDSGLKNTDCKATGVNKHFMARINTRRVKSANETQSSHRSLAAQRSNVLQDITNSTNNTNRRLLSAWPDDDELGKIVQVNNMISNFVVSYFFKIFAGCFGNILFTEFLFDFVKREGGWKFFVQSSRKAGLYKDFLDKLSHHKSVCIVPICCNTHWTLLVRRYIGHSWKILFIDSLSAGSDKRFRDWKALFFDNDLFSGEWIKVKIYEQSELECGARVCLHGVCFGLSKKKTADIIGDLSRFKDLSVRSRLMVSAICKDGFWSSHPWLRRIIGDVETFTD